jgi:hypothetical protein
MLSFRCEKSPVLVAVLDRSKTIVAVYAVYRASQVVIINCVVLL